LIEDDPWVRDACVDLLGSAGYTVVAIDDAAQGLDEIPRLLPDLILLDLIMPNAQMDGIGLLSRLAADRACTIPIIILSALGKMLAETISPQIIEALRIAAILPKPVKIETLTQEIDRALAQTAER
jgi:CheY-like chemotaxis protein